jgi:hypothetical protein
LLLISPVLPNPKNSGGTVKRILLFIASLVLSFTFLIQPITGKTFSQRGFVNRIANPNFLLAVEMGLIPGFSSLDKYGINPLIETTTTPEDIWEGGGIYPYDADGTAPIVSLASDATNDTQPIKITGLDVSGDQVVQTIDLSGDTRVALTTPLWRAFRLENEGTTDLTGTVFVYTGTGSVPSVGDSEVRAIIDNGNNQTLMAIYTIPRGKVGFLHRGEAGLEYAAGNVSSLGEFVTGYYKSRRYGKVFKVKKSISMLTAATSVYQDLRTFPGVLPALTDIKLQIMVVSEDCGVWGTFDILLVDEDLFPTTFLTAIGQPGY